jgi:hypothetical protein
MNHPQGQQGLSLRVVAFARRSCMQLCTPFKVHVRLSTTVLLCVCVYACCRCVQRRRSSHRWRWCVGACTRNPRGREAIQHTLTLPLPCIEGGRVAAAASPSIHEGRVLLQSDGCWSDGPEVLRDGLLPAASRAALQGDKLLLACLYACWADTVSLQQFVVVGYLHQSCFS